MQLYKLQIIVNKLHEMYKNPNVKMLLEQHEISYILYILEKSDFIINFND